MREVLNQMEGVTLHEKHGGRFLFQMYPTQEMMKTSIEALDLNVRPYNCLRRRGISTIGEIIKIIEEGGDLKSLRNCGAKSVREIMEKLFLFQYNSLKPERREKYLLEVVRINEEIKFQVAM